MALQISIQSVDAAGQTLYVSFNVTPSNSPAGYVTGGDPMNFTASGTLPVNQDPAFIGLVAAIESSSGLQIDVWSQGGNLNQQYIPIVTKVAGYFNPQTGVKLKTNAVGTFATEHAQANYEASILNDIITGFAIFTKIT